MSRFKVKPGLTGWAQIHGHDQRIKIDRGHAGGVWRSISKYIENWSLELDLRIVLLTVWQMAGRVFEGLRKAAASRSATNAAASGRRRPSRTVRQPPSRQPAQPATPRQRAAVCASAIAVTGHALGVDTLDQRARHPA